MLLNFLYYSTSPLLIPSLFNSYFYWNDIDDYQEYPWTERKKGNLSKRRP